MCWTDETILTVLQPLQHSASVTNEDDGTTHSNDTSFNQVARKGRTLDQYLRKWLANTKHTLTISPSDWEIKGNSELIQCTKCNVNPFQVLTEKGGYWKPTAWKKHVINEHRVTGKGLFPSTCTEYTLNVFCKRLSYKFRPIVEVLSAGEKRSSRILQQKRARADAGDGTG